MHFFKNSWDEKLSEEMAKPYFLSMLSELDYLYDHKKIYPPRGKIFNALKTTPFGQIKVVMLGQDPYHGPGQAHGLCFSVCPGVAIPPSLKNIFKEQEDDLGIVQPNHGYLQSWAEQGVLMLNTVLTVEEGKPNSHANLGWQKFTDRVIEIANTQEQPIVFLLWGRNAISKAKFIDKNKHLVLTTVHPSPLSAYAGFFGCRHFSKCNEFLKNHGIEPINWQLPELK